MSRLLHPGTTQAHLAGWADASPVGSCSPSARRCLPRPRAARPVPAHRLSPARLETVASTSTCSGHSVSDSEWLRQLRAAGERGPGSGRVTWASALSAFALGPWLGTHRPCRPSRFWKHLVGTGPARQPDPDTLDPRDPAPAGWVRRPGVAGAAGGRGEAGQPCLPLPEAWPERREDRANAANGPAQRGNGDPALGSRSQCTSALRLLTTS